jgi:hypothetical protein
MRYSADLEIRFWEKVDKSAGPSGCWIWKGGKDKNGYGRIRINKVEFGAHRLSWEIANCAKIPQGLVVMHKCDNPICVNPNHLMVGTHGDNHTDCARKGRNHKWSSPGFTGEAYHKSTLTEKQVKEIRATYNRKAGMTLEKLGHLYNVTMVTICHIVHRKTWRYL